MKKCICIFLVSIVCLPVCPINCSAQVADSTAFYDSLLTDYNVRHSDLYKVEGDTVLKRFQKVDLTYDSIKSYKSQRDFAYIKYLDSLLRKTKGLTVDTFSLGNNKNIKNKKRSNRSRVDNAGPTVMDSSFVRFFLWMLALGFIVFVLYRLFLNESIFRRSPGQHPLTFTQQQEESVLEPSAYEKLINAAIANRQFRLAIRYLYLQTLQKLSIAGLILFSPDKTNYEYVKDLAGKSHQSDFAAITRNYEYVWYGKFEIDQEIFSRLQDNFRQYHQKI